MQLCMCVCLCVCVYSVYCACVFRFCVKTCTGVYVGAYAKLSICMQSQIYIHNY